MTPAQEAVLRAAFLKVRDEGPTQRKCGVCYNVSVLIADQHTPSSYRIVGTLAASWPELHPEAVPADRGEYMYPIAMTGEGLWEGEQLRLRISLINHILDHLDTYQE